MHAIIMADKNSVIIDDQDITERVIHCEITRRPDKIPVHGGTVDGLMNNTIRILLAEGIDAFPFVGRSLDVTIRWKEIAVDGKWILSNSSTSVSLILKPSGN
jgi:hypothetical protein